MKRYILTILAGHSHWTEIVEAEYFDSQTNSSTSKGYYAFFANSALVACYPIGKTIIKSIEKIEK